MLCFMISDFFFPNENCLRSVSISQRQQLGQTSLPQYAHLSHEDLRQTPSYKCIKSNRKIKEYKFL